MDVDVDAIWADLERRLPIGAHGRQQQRIYPDARPDLFLAALAPGPRRSLLLNVVSTAVEQIEELPAARGVSVLLLRGNHDSQSTLELQLDEPGADDVFAALVADVARSTAETTDDEASVQVFLGRLGRWMRLLQREAEGLSGERQRGMYAELWFIRERLAGAIGLGQAIEAWQGPSGAAHDFQTAAGSVEVKSTATNQPQVVRISSERQLDETGTPALHLLHVSLDVHRDSGESLLEMITSLRHAVAGGPVASLFEDRLLDAGFADVHAPNYAHTGYTLREVNLFALLNGFPRITEHSLPAGVGGVSYTLSVAACLPFRVEEDAVLASLGGTRAGP
jgi:Putative  PD-(D/E)XK family member, (DUF4420)